jgi:hypothetical protein
MAYIGTLGWMTLYVKACYVAPGKIVQKLPGRHNARQAKLAERAHGGFAHQMPRCRAIARTQLAVTAMPNKFVR